MVHYVSGYIMRLTEILPMTRKLQTNRPGGLSRTETLVWWSLLAGFALLFVAVVRSPRVLAEALQGGLSFLP